MQFAGVVGSPEACGIVTRGFDEWSGERGLEGYKHNDGSDDFCAEVGTLYD